MSISLIKYDIIVSQPEFPHNFLIIVAPLSHLRASELGCELRAGSTQSELLCSAIRAVTDVKELFPGFLLCWEWRYSPHPSLCCADQEKLGFTAAFYRGPAEVPLFHLFIQIGTTGRVQSQPG